jgi:hypothetical protein
VYVCSSGWLGPPLTGTLLPDLPHPDWAGVQHRQADISDGGASTAACSDSPGCERRPYICSSRHHHPGVQANAQVSALTAAEGDGRPALPVVESGALAAFAAVCWQLSSLLRLGCCALVRCPPAVAILKSSVLSLPSRVGEYRGHGAPVRQMLVLGDVLLSLGADRRLLVWRIGKHDSPEVSWGARWLLLLREQPTHVRCSTSC